MRVIGITPGKNSDGGGVSPNQRRAAGAERLNMEAILIKMWQGV